METTPNTHGLIRRSEAILLIAHTHRLKEAELDRTPQPGLVPSPQPGTELLGGTGAAPAIGHLPGDGDGPSSAGCRAGGLHPWATSGDRAKAGTAKGNGSQRERLRVEWGRLGHH